MAGELVIVLTGDWLKDMPFLLDSKAQRNAVDKEDCVFHFE